MSLRSRLDRRAQIAATRTALGDRAAVWLHSAAEGPNSALDVLPIVAAPLVVPYPDSPQYGEKLAALVSALKQMRVGHATGPVQPFARGWVLYLAYDFASVFEASVPMRKPPGTEPLAVLWRADEALSWNQDSAEFHLAVGVPESAVREQIAGSVSEVHPMHFAIAEDDPRVFTDGVERVLEYLHAGDVFQVNLSRAWTAQSDSAIDPATLFERLSDRNPAQFAALMSVGDFHLLSSSPERLVRIEGAQISTRPIAGTRRRSENPGEDQQLRSELNVDPKERAEHIMLIDLERNDLGRVCEAGSVVVDELGVIESYAHVHHLVSNVRGTLRSGASAFDVLRALFPGGTITGCPKVRCMQIIGELEGQGRGAYTGSLGYIGDDGNMDMNILIRTLTVEGKCVRVRAGAGIVADSNPFRELEETRAKAKGMLRALAP